MEYSSGSRTVQCTASLIRAESGAIESVLSVTLQTLNKFAKNNELEKIKLYILMGANPDRRVHRLSPPPHPLAWPSAQGLLVPRAVLQRRASHGCGGECAGWTAVRFGEDGRTPLHIAAAEGHENLVKCATSATPLQR